MNLCPPIYFSLKWLLQSANEFPTFVQSTKVEVEHESETLLLSVCSISALSDGSSFVLLEKELVELFCGRRKGCK